MNGFDENWKKREESLYNHWTAFEPQNQIQFAFRQHWEVFQMLLKEKSFNKGMRTLEVGCGRGSLSAYFSNAGYDCTLLDLSPKAIEIAESIFKQNQLKAQFCVGDALNLPFDDDSFDVVFSIGLFEHFNDQQIEKLVKEQSRILSKGGAFIAYIVPEYTQNVQKSFTWINEILKGYAGTSESPDKEEVYRNSFESEYYIPIIQQFGIEGIQKSGIYPLPMISHSIDFPFTLMPNESEQSLVKHFKEEMRGREKLGFSHPWLCEEGFGQAFIIWGYKR